ncbi:MAG: hypothetical protein J6T04_01845 [Bacteroidales bacterium]|nr:hypothetical protein [Bacteroidales bacterium]
MEIKRRMTIMTQKQPKYTTMPTDSPEDFQSLKVYTKAVRDYLINKLGTSEQVAESLVRRNSAALEGYWEDKLPVSGTATGLMLNLL